MQILSFLEEAAVLEETLSLCYLALAGRAAPAAVKEEFERLANEERNHALVLRTGKSYVKKEPGLFGRTIIDRSELQTGLMYTRAVGEAVRGEALLFRDAVIRVRDLEMRFEKLHMATVMPIQDETLRELFLQLARDDKSHRLVLERIIAELRPE